jgi:cystathionine beta-lyase
LRYDFDKKLNRNNTNCIKWDRLTSKYGYRKILPFSIADMDFESPVEIREVLIERAKHGVFGYAYIPNSYSEALINWMKKRHQYDIDSAWISYVPGVIPGINIGINAFSEVGDKILIQSPVYPPFYSIVNNSGRIVVNNKLSYKNGRYEIDFDLLEKQLSDEVKIMLICSPHNPVGRVWTKDELTKISQLCLKYNVMVISDEIHGDIVYSKHKQICFASISEEARNNSAICISPAKTFNIPGVSIASTIISNPKLYQKYKRTSTALLGSGVHDIFAILAGEAAYTHGEQWLEQLLIYLESNSDHLEKHFADNIKRIKYIKPEGTYLAWLDCRRLEIKAEDLRDYFINFTRLELNDGISFGEGGKGFLRFNFACPRIMVNEALERIEGMLGN